MVSKKTMRDAKKLFTQNCSSQKNIRIYFGQFFDRTPSFCFNFKKTLCKNEKFHFPAKIYETRWKRN